jgi:formamidopyrimidine-DNA glycosylase
VARLAASTRQTLVEATAARRGIPPSELRAAKHAALRVHRQTGAGCPVCGDEIRDFMFSGAVAQYCPTCQTGGVELA